MIKDFIGYILGAIEDDEIPYEIKHIYFCLHKKEFYFYLSVGGSELKLNNVINFEYYPLELQFFDLKKYTQNFTLFDLKRIIEKSLNNKEFFKAFEFKELYVAIFGEKQSFIIEKV